MPVQQDTKAVEEANWKIIPSVSDVESDLKAGCLLGNRVTDTTEAILFVKDKVKNASSIMKFGIETFDKLANPILIPVLKSVDERVVKKVDSMLGYGYKSAIEAGTKIYDIVDVDQDGKISWKEARDAPVNIWAGLVVKSEWFDNVDKILNPANITPENLVSRFNEAASSEFKKFVEGAKYAVDKYTSKEFIEGLKEQMQEAWDEKLKAPAEAFLELAKKKYAEVDANGNGILSIKEILSSLHPVWEEQVVKVFRQRLRPAIIAYRSFLTVFTHYKTMAEKEGIQITSEAFITKVKQDLQEAYDEKLRPHILEFYEGASQLVTEDLQRIVNALDMDEDKKITLNDFILLGNALLKKFVATPYKSALCKTIEYVDTFIPEEQPMDIKEIAEDVSLSLVTKTISKRLVKKAFSGFSNLKMQTETLIGPDLIKYAEDLMKDVNDKQITPALKNLEEKVDMFKVYIAEGVKPVQDAVRDAAVKAMESARAKELKKRFDLAVERAQGLAKNGMDYFLKRELLKLPVDFGEFFAMTVGIKQKGEEYDAVVAMVSDLVKAILDVVKVVGWKEKKVDDAPVVEEEAESEEKTKAADEE